ncbi:MAG: HAD family hydrolase [Planctomycetota bacterium]|nr:HAD family hydrolase [Planctomycetota bacterium]MDP7248508.1 HAD family hydrolase [Planctomycetota bacterium]
MTPTPEPIRGVIFDLDGTLTRPILDFNAIRAALEIPGRTPILEYLDTLEPEDRDHRSKMLDDFEARAANDAEFNNGVPELLDFLYAASVRIAIVTRNSRACLNATLSKLDIRVQASVTREDAPVKPSPEPALLAARLIEVEPAFCIFIGDFQYDIITGQAAGMRTALIPSQEPPDSMPAPDFRVETADELIPLLRPHIRERGVDL